MLNLTELLLVNRAVCASNRNINKLDQMKHFQCFHAAGF